ncbi:hypothetical protein L7F22_003047 [Adiantum nelumboides]|nr:hypothetical protein [Adiantum nelumboides]
MILSPRRQTFELNGGGSVSIGSNGSNSISSTTSSGNHHSNNSSSRLGNGASFANSGSRVRVNSSITFSEAVSSHPIDEEYRMPYRDRKLSESVVSLTHVVEEEENITPSTFSITDDEERLTSPISPTTVQWPGASALPMARSTSQRRISQEINLRGNSPRTPNILDENRNAIGITPIRHPGAPSRRNSGRSSNGLATPRNPVRSMSVGGVSVPALNKTADDYFSVGSDDGFSEVASSSAVTTTTSQRVPFPRSMSTSGTFTSDSPSARRIGRHLSLSAAQSTESIDRVPISPRFADLIPATPKSSAAGASSGTRKSHFRYSSDLHIARPNFTTSRSEASYDHSSRSRFGSEVGSLYANTLDDSASMSGVKLTRDPTSVKPSKHRLILTEEGKADVTLQLGNCIGRGQFGSVYRALNLNTGQMVAVKRIKLNNRSEDEVTQLMHEVELLKSLVHPSVVKYEGLVRGEDVVSIVLEYVENGSLLHTLKAFGNFPEKLVASYVVKILEGLNYLHEMKVVHCDLKAANILTTKNGNVKLSDFGVSLNLKAAEDLKKNDAIGTPNWMAPEVIELKGASTAADIWSLGCTIIELLTGKPPYGDMLAMSAMWRIVEDDCPPLPKNISDTLLEFLTHCFQKDPALRPSAAMLSEHAWLRTTWGDHKGLRPQDSVPFFKRIASGDQRKGSIRKSTLENGGTLERKGTAGRTRQATVTQADVLISLPARNSEPTAITETIKSCMERSTSSPSEAALLRPNLHNLRASSAPDAWSAKPAKEVTFSEDEDEPSKMNFYSPAGASTALSVSPPAMLPSESMCRRGSDVTSTNTSLDLLRSPSTMAGMEKERNGLGDGMPLDPSMLDLTSPSTDVFMLDEQASLNKTHAFVKSTFSKPVLCKICRDSVKKHAVLCEDCGLICHASCAKRAITPCNLRAQLLMLANHRSSLDMTRVLSPTPSASTPPPPTPTSMASPPIFRFPFGKYKRNSKGGASDLNLPATLSSSPRTAVIEADPIVLPNIPKSPPLTPMSPESKVQGKKDAEDGNKRQKRTRRISLLPSHLMRQRSPSPSPLVGKPIIISHTPLDLPTHEHNRTNDSSNGMVRSPSSTQSIHDDSLGYGSSASSMSSSFQLGSPTSQMSSAGRSQFPSIEIRAIGGSNKISQPSSHDVPVSRAALQANRRQRHLSASAAALSIGSTPNFTHHSSHSNGMKISDSQPKAPARHASHGLPWSRAQFSSSGGFASMDEGEMTDRSMGAAALALARGSHLDQKLPNNHHDVRGDKKHNRRLSSKPECIIA